MTVMKRTALALLLCLLAFAATAQNVTVIGPITPGDCTMFSSTTVLKDAGFACPGGGVLTITGPLTINPTASTYNQGEVITQTGPTTTIAGPVSYNLITATQQSAVTGSGVDATGNLTTVSAAFRVNLFAQGTNLAGQANDAILGAVANTVASPSAGDSIGVAGTVYRNINSAGGMYGVVPYVFLDTGGIVAHLVGIESDVNITTATGAAATNRAAFRAMNAGPHQAGTLDAAFVVGNINAATGAFQKMMALSGVFGNAPIATTGDLFFNDGAMTVANVFNMSTLTVTANIMNFPNVTIAGSGVATFKGSSFQIGNQTPSGSTAGNVKCYLAASCYYGADNGTQSSIFGADTSGGVAGTVSNHDFRLISNNVVVATVLAAGNFKFNTAANFSANASVATVLGSIGPVGSHTTVQKWLTVVDNTGATLYIPTF